MTNLDLLRSRHSVRNFDNQPLDDDTIRHLRAEITYINSHDPSLFIELVVDDNIPFQGFTTSYGFFKGIRNYIAVVVDDHFPNAIERAGYYGEQLVTYTTKMGLGTCFVGGMFNAENVKVNLRAGHRVLYLIALGREEGKPTMISSMMTKIIHRKNMSWQQYFEPDDILEDVLSKMPWLEDGLKAIQSAPSAMNRRPVRIHRKNDGSLAAFVKDESNTYALLDLGIAKYNFQFVVSGVWEWGNDAPFIKDI